MTSELSADGRTRTYRVSGQVFFASSERFADAFDFKAVLDTVVIDLTAAHFSDISAVGSLDRAILRFRREGTHVEVVGLNQASATMVDRFAVHDKPGAEAALGAIEERAYEPRYWPVSMHPPMRPASSIWRPGPRPGSAPMSSCCTSSSAGRPSHRANDTAARSASASRASCWRN